MNTKVERFAFAMALLVGFLIPVVWAVFPLFVFGTMDREPAEQLIRTMQPIVMIVTAVFFPLFCVFCSLWVESAHFKALDEAEKEFSYMTVSDMRTIPPNWKPEKTVFVCENVVIANDYFKAFLWFFRKLVGGRSRSFEKLVERGRREATLRLMQTARRYGANVVWNVRFETTIVQFNSGGHEKAMAGLEFMAYGTAFLVE